MRRDPDSTQFFGRDYPEATDPAAGRPQEQSAGRPVEADDEDDDHTRVVHMGNLDGPESEPEEAQQPGAGDQGRAREEQQSWWSQPPR